MTTTTILEFDLYDRMRKSLRVAGMTSGQMADFLEVRSETVSTWLNGRHKPAPMALRLWAQRTDVPLTWLLNGEVPPSQEDGTDVRPEGFEPPAYCSVAAPRQSQLSLVA